MRLAPVVLALALVLLVQEVASNPIIALIKLGKPLRHRILRVCARAARLDTWDKCSVLVEREVWKVWKASTTVKYNMGLPK